MPKNNTPKLTPKHRALAVNALARIRFANITEAALKIRRNSTAPTLTLPREEIEALGLVSIKALGIDITKLTPDFIFKTES